MVKDSNLLTTASNFDKKSLGASFYFFDLSLGCIIHALRVAAL
jgi:hypothetical protein